MITPTTGSSRQLETVIRLKRVITGVICDHAVITIFLLGYWPVFPILPIYFIGSYETPIIFLFTQIKLPVI